MWSLVAAERTSLRLEAAAVVLENTCFSASATDNIPTEKCTYFLSLGNRQEDKSGQASTRKAVIWSIAEYELASCCETRFLMPRVPAVALTLQTLSHSRLVHLVALQFATNLLLASHVP